MNTTTLLLQLALAGLYFGSGYLLRHLQSPAPPAAADPAPGGGSGPILQHLLAEVEAQAVSMIRGTVANVLQNAAQAPAAAPAAPPAGTPGK